MRRTLKGYYMLDEVHLVCECGYARAIPLTLASDFDGIGQKLVSGDTSADHVYNNRTYP